MILSKIILENFMSFLGRHEVNVPKGLIRIQGKNMDSEGANSNRSGKTSFLNTITATPYAKTPLVARGVNLINENTDSANLELVFDNHFCIKRYFKDKKFQNGLFFSGGIDNYSPITQDQLEKNLGLNFESFTATVFFGTAYSDFLEKILRKPAEAKDLLISLLPNLQVFDIALQWIKNKISDTEKELRVINNNLLTNTGKLDSYRSMNFATEIEKFEQNRLSDISRIEKEINDLNRELKAKEKESIPNLEIVYKKFLVDKNIIQGKYNEISNAYSAILTASKYLEREIDSLRKEIRTLEMGKCPTCGQSLLKRTDVLSEKNELLNTKMKQMSINNLKTDKLYKELDRVGSELEATKQEEEGFEKLRALNVKILTLKNTIINKQTNITNLINQKNPHIAKEAEATRAMIEIQKEIGKLKTDLEKGNEILQYYIFWEKGFGPRGIKNFIFDELVFALTDLSQTYLDEMTNNTMTIRFNPRKAKKNSEGFIETIGLEISSRNDPRDYFTWSASERKKISLAVDLAMHQMLGEIFSSPFDLMIFDETFDGLDSVGVELFCSTLRKQLKRTPQIFVVSHIELPDIFDHTITIVKENGCSRIENGFVGKKLLRRK